MTVRPEQRWALAAIGVLVLSLALEVGYGAGLGQSLVYLGYEGLFVLGPGWLAFRVLSSRPGGPLRQLAFGWALGYVLEVLAFMATAAMGTRWLFLAYPALVAVAAASVAKWGRPAPREEDEAIPDGFLLACAGVCALAIAYIAFSYFPVTPLPGTEGFYYFPDYPWALSIAADAKHHWPIQDPNVSGQPFPYHYFVHIHLAAASQVTGLSLPLVYFRLFVLPLTVSIVLGLAAAGRSLAGSYRVGLIAAALVFFVGDLQMDASHSIFSQLPFVGVLFTFLITSPSFMFGLVIFTPLIVMVAEHITAKKGETRLGDWVLLGLFAIGATDAKVSILPLVLAALAAFAIGQLVFSRRISRNVLISGVLVALIFGVVYVLQYRGHSSGLRLDLLAGIHFFENTHAVTLIRQYLDNRLPGFPGKHTFVSGAGVVIGLLGLLAAQLVGLVALLRRDEARTPTALWLFALLGAGLLELFVINAEGSGNQLYAFFYGVTAGCLLSAQGLWLAWSSRPPLEVDRVRFVAMASAWLVSVAILIILPVRLGDHLSQPATYFLLYGGLVVTLAALYVAARALLKTARWPAAALLCGAVLAIGTIGTPLDNVEPGIASPPGPVESGRRTSLEMFTALSWIREHTAADAVLAVNNQNNGVGPFDFDYSAFAERRVFIEGWGYSVRARDLGYGDSIAGKISPYAARLALNAAAFTGDAHALQTLRTVYGVRYLLVDSVNGFGVKLDALRRSTRIVYRAPGVVVLRINP